MIYKYCGAVAFVLLGLSLVGVLGIPTIITGVLLIIAGIALAIGQ